MAPTYTCKCRECLNQNPAGMTCSRDTKVRHEREQTNRRKAKASVKMGTSARQSSTKRQVARTASRAAPQTGLSTTPVPPRQIDLSTTLGPALDLATLLVAFIVLRGRLGHNNSNALLRGLSLLFDMVITLICAPFHAAGFQVQHPRSRIYQDIRSVYQQHDLNPQLIATPCCPRCFTISTPGKANRHSNQCEFKRSSRSSPCGAPLVKRKRVKHPDPEETIRTTRASNLGLGGTIPSTKLIPTAYYISQSLDAWIRWMLLCPHIEDCLRATVQRTQNMAGPLARMNDVQDSPAWFAQKPWLTKGGYRLVFSMFIDWFNPYTNKIAGKVVSCGVIILYCLNLPFQIRLRLENVFVAGMMPAPNAPDVYTISNILEVLVAELLTFWRQSRMIPSVRFPEGAEVEIQVWPFVSDLQAACKCGGHVFPTGKQFCNGCTLDHDDRSCLDVSRFTPRDSLKTKQAAAAWKAAKTLVKKEELAKATGVRWTPLHDLPNWDPVRHVKIGWMHNWLEGVLQHHLRVYWGIGRPTALVKRLGLMEEDEASNDEDQRETDSEQQSVSAVSTRPEDDLGMMGMFTDDVFAPGPPPESDDSDDGDSSETSTIRGTSYVAARSESDEDDDLVISPFANGVFDFTTESTAMIRQGFGAVTYPSYVSRPPLNLGEAKHGKLKADLELVLFGASCPLVMPIVWWFEEYSPQANPAEIAFIRLLRENFYDLTECTYILASFSTTNAEADRYLKHYISYRSSSHILFPFVNDRPNHHIAMHNHEQLKFWGPAPGLAENNGEQLNGQFGRIPTSRRPYDLTLTLMRQINRRARLEASLNDPTATPDIARLSAALRFQTAVYTDANAPPTMSPEEAQRFIGNGERMDKELHNAFVQYLQQTDGLRWVAGINMRSSSDEAVPELVKFLPHIHVDDGKLSFSTYDSNPSQSHIRFLDPTGQKAQTGVIRELWTVPLDNVLRTFALVELHKPLDPSYEHNEKMSPFAKTPRVRLFEDQQSDEYHIISDTDILCGLTTRSFSASVFEFGVPTIAVCWGLDRGRRGVPNESRS